MAQLSLGAADYRALPTPTVALIVRDEADMLLDCLASVAGHADELVVVDMGSTDASPKIAAAYALGPVPG